MRDFDINEVCYGQLFYQRIQIRIETHAGGDPCTILENEFVKPGKGQAFNRVKFRNLKNGRVLGAYLQIG